MSKSRATRLVIDTNIWISFLIGKALQDLESLLYNKRVQILLSSEQLAELGSVLQRPRLKKYFSESQIIEFLELIDQVTDYVDITSSIDLCRDKKDNFLLSLAVDGNADYLITGDEDLLILREVQGIPIISYKDFKKKVI